MGRAEGGLARRAAAGVAWQGFSYALSRVVVLITTVILARLLAPDDFGLFGLALVFITYSEYLTDVGVAQGLVFFPRDRRRDNAAMVASLVIAGVVTLLAIGAAPLIANFFGEPDVTSLFRVMAVSLFFRGTGNVPDALLRKELQFRRRLMAEFGRAAVQAAVSIPLAIAGAGAWAIVLGYVAGTAAWSAIAWLLVDYRPSRSSFRLEREYAQPLIAFGLPAAGQLIVLTLVYDIDYLIVGRELGSVALGFYLIAFRIPQSVIIPAFWALSAVAFPVLSMVHADAPRLKRGYLSWMRVQSAFGVTAGLGLTATAPMLIEGLFGPRWEPSIVPLQALGLHTAGRAFTNGAFDLYKSVGRPRLAFGLSVLSLAVVVPALLYGTRWGIEGVAWAQAATSVALGVLLQWVSVRVVGIRAGTFLRALLPTAAAGLGVLVGAGVVRLWLPGPVLLRLIVAMAAGAIVGLGALHAADRNFLRQVWNLLARRRPEEPGADGDTSVERTP